MALRRCPRLCSQSLPTRGIASISEPEKNKARKLKPRTKWADIATQRDHILAIGSRLGIAPDDLNSWYKVTNRKLIEMGGAVLLRKYDSSRSKLLGNLFPEHLWDRAKFLKRPQNYWKDPKMVRDLMDEFGSKLGIAPGDTAAWYKVSSADLIRVGGKAILSSFESRIGNLLKAAYPEFKWDVQNFARKPHHYWKSVENQRINLERLGEKLGIARGDLEKWYGVSYATFLDIGGGSLLSQHGSSISKVLIANYPEHNWDLNRFDAKPRSFWKSDENARSFLVDLGLRLGVKSDDLSGWYKIGVKEIIEAGGGTLLSYNDSSPSTMLKAIFPEHVWDDARFSNKRRSYWEDPSHRRAALENIGVALGITKGDMEPWYKVQSATVLEKGGGSLLALHNFSMVSVLTSIFPEHTWDPYRFSKKVHHYWSDPVQARIFLDSIGSTLGSGAESRGLEGWYKVTNDDLIKAGAGALLRYHNYSICSLLSSVYPDHEWHEWKFARKGNKSLQNGLESATAVEETEGSLA